MVPLRRTSAEEGKESKQPCYVGESPTIVGEDMKTKRLASSALLIGLALTACTNTNQVPDTRGAATPAPTESLISTEPAADVESCSRVRIPRNVELDTGLDRENGLLTVNYTPPGTARNKSVTVRYRRDNCGWPSNRSIRRVIVHVLKTASPQKARGTYVIGECFEPTRQPVRMVLACADFGLRASRLEWTSWTNRRAEGRGTFVTKDFTEPDYGTDERTGLIVLTGRRYCIDHERFTFWRGTITLDRPIEGQREIDIYPACGIANSAKP